MRLVDHILLHINVRTISQALHAATEKALRLANMELQQVENRSSISYDFTPFPERL